VRPAWLPTYFSPAVARDLGCYLDEARGDGPPLTDPAPAERLAEIERARTRKEEA
jgi:hypothetical protein